MESKPKTRGKYKKHKEGYKISVRHYIHNKIKVNLAHERIHRPLYIQLIAKQSTINFKSRIETNYCSVEKLRIMIDEDVNFQKLLKRETDNIILMTQEAIVVDGDMFNVVSVPHIYNQMSDFGEVLRRKLADVIKAEYNNQVERDKEYKNSNDYDRIHPAILFNKWQNIPEIVKVKELLKTDLWNFDFYYAQFLASGQQEDQLYPSLTPLMLDYENGWLKEEMLKFFSENQDIINDLFDDIETIMNYKVVWDRQGKIFPSK
jgi:hypothetical protein